MHCIPFLNSTASSLLVLVNTSFRQHDIKRYVRERLSPALRDAVLFTDFMPRRQALHQLVPGALSPNLGSAETFSYACVETIDHGLLPTVRHGTPMVEFFPEDMQQHILPSNLGAMRQIQSHMEKLIADGKGVTTRVREHCRETLHPVKIAEQMGKLYESELHKKRKRHTVQVKKNLRLEDITILIPAYSPGAEFAETVDSIVAQTAGVPKVIVCDDGSPENNAHWLEYARTQLPFCEIIKQPNGRLLSARLALLDACQTEAAIFLDADDLLGEQAISKLLEAWNNAPWSIDAVIPHRQNIGESNEAILRNYLDDHLHLLRNDFRMTSLIRTEVLRNISFDPSRRNGEADDWLFWLEFSLLGHRALMVPGNLFFYRFSTGSMSWPWSEGQHVGTQTMLRELFERYGKNSPDVANLMSRALFFLQTGG